MENPTHTFRETNFLLQFIEESQIKSKIVMSWSSHKKKEGILCNIYFLQRKFFNICVLSQYTEYTLRIYILLHIKFLSVFKTAESLQCISLIEKIFERQRSVALISSIFLIIIITMKILRNLKIK